VLGVDDDVVLGQVVRRDCLPKTWQTQGLRVARVAPLHRLLSSVLDDIGRRQIRVADLQPDDVATRRLELLRAGDDVHDHERPDELGTARNRGHA
jgi:hypothetical protein